MRGLLCTVALVLSLSTGGVAQSSAATTSQAKVCKPKTKSLSTCQVTSTIFETVSNGVLPTCDTNFATTTATETTTLTVYPSQAAAANATQYRTTITETVFQTLQTQITDLILQTEIVDVTSVLNFNQILTTLQTVQTQVTDTIFETEVVNLTSVLNFNQTLTTIQTLQTQVTDSIFETEIIDLTSILNFNQTLTTVQTALATDITTLPIYQNITKTIPVNITAVQTSVFVITQTSIVTVSVEPSSSSTAPISSALANSTATSSSTASASTATSTAGPYDCTWFKIYNYTAGATPGLYVGVDSYNNWRFAGPESEGIYFTIDPSTGYISAILESGFQLGQTTEIGPDGTVQYDVYPVSGYPGQENVFSITTQSQFDQYQVSHYVCSVDPVTGILLTFIGPNYNYTGTNVGVIWSIDQADLTTGQYDPVTLAITCQPGPPVPPQCPSFDIYIFTNAVFGDGASLDSKRTLIDGNQGVANTTSPSYTLTNGNLVDTSDGSIAYVYPGGVSNITFGSAPNATQTALNCTIEYLPNNIIAGALTCSDGVQDMTFLTYQNTNSANASSNGDPYGVYFANADVLSSQMYWQATLFVQCSI